MAAYPRKYQYPYQRPAGNAAGISDSDRNPIRDVLLSIRGRRPSLPETNSMAGRACVRHVVLHTVSLSRKRAFAVSLFRQTTHEQVFTTLLRMIPP